jgi:GNAT superfamily N-acetyltransferase
MKLQPVKPAVAAPRGDLMIVRASDPTVSFYRWLYNTVGGPWLWLDRRKLDDAALGAIIQREDVEVWVLYAGGVPAGYYELDRRQPPEIELTYFGLCPEFIGQKLGPYLLDQAIRKAWSYKPARLWVHTQSLDHPRALSLYKQHGFDEYKDEVLVLDVRLP